MQGEFETIMRQAGRTSIAQITKETATREQVVPSAIMVVALALTLDKQPMQLRLLKEGDWAGIATMAIGLSAFQTVLEEGEKNDWFASPFIIALMVMSRVQRKCIGAVKWSCRFAPTPGRSTTTGMCCCWSNDPGPMPEICRSCGEL